MQDNQSPSPPTGLPLSDEEAAFADALVGFFGALESLSVARAQLQASSGDALRAFLSTIPEESRGDAAMQWPMLSLMLDSLKNVGA